MRNKTLLRAGLVLFALLATSPLTACEKREGPVERTGEKIGGDRGKDAGEKIDESGEKMREAGKEATEDK
jgi:hypothetical protein